MVRAVAGLFAVIDVPETLSVLGGAEVEVRGDLLLDEVAVLLEELEATL